MNADLTCSPFGISVQVFWEFVVLESNENSTTENKGKYLWVTE